MKKSYTILFICIFIILLILVSKISVYKPEHFNNFSLSRKISEHFESNMTPGVRDYEFSRHPEKPNSFLVNDNPHWKTLYNRNLVIKNKIPISFCKDENKNENVCPSIRRNSNSDISINLPKAGNVFQPLNGNNRSKYNGDVEHSRYLKSLNGQLMVGNNGIERDSGNSISVLPITNCQGATISTINTDKNVVFKNKSGESLLTISPSTSTICFGDGTNQNVCLNKERINKIRNLSNQLVSDSAESLDVDLLGIQNELIVNENANIHPKYGKSLTATRCLDTDNINLNKNTGETYLKLKKHKSDNLSNTTYSSLENARKVCNTTGSCRGINYNRRSKQYTLGNSKNAESDPNYDIHFKINNNRLQIGKEIDTAWHFETDKTNEGLNIRPSMKSGIQIGNNTKMEITNNNVNLNSQNSEKYNINSNQIRALNGSHPVTIANVKNSPNTRPQNKIKDTYSGLLIDDTLNFAKVNPKYNKYFTHGNLYNEFYITPWSSHTIE